MSAPAAAVALADYDFHLPPGQIALRPAARRDAARLLCLDRATGALAHRAFSDLAGLLSPGDLVVLNDTRVFPARAYGTRPRTGGRVEVLFHEELGQGAWRVMARGPLRAGEAISLEGGLVATVAEVSGGGFATLRVDGDVHGHLSRHGHVPLPPYIRRPDDARDRDDYQTVFARETGSVAAPTAGLHFTERTLEALEGRGIGVARLTLHVGPGTFLPVRAGRPEDHRMHAEPFEIPRATADTVAATRAAGNRVIACGTTAVRALEASGGAAGAGRTDLFIRPGFRFGVTDGLITNFHLPRSTLLMLVAAFAGRERVLSAYGEALRAGYRFYSYGDAMLVL